MRQRAFIRRLIAGVAAIIAIVAVVDVSLPPTIERAGDVSPLALDRNGEWLHAFSNSQGRWRFGADLNEIDPVFIERLIAIEDSRFYQHPGVDLLAVMRAGASAVRSGQIVSGASTITMQTARLLEPRPRNLGSKIVEMLRALQLERRLSKREILELYLTLAPYGGNLEGVRAASLSYFGKEPTRLNDAEQALLIALPQAPEARRPDLKSDHAKAARARILTKLVRINAINSLHANEASDAPVPEARRPLPRLAYHAATAQTDNAPIVRTTLDAQLQAQAESLVTRHAEQFDDGATASLLIIENETRAVLASVGSSGFDAPGGWIDLTAATRSPGSTLKPFIYAVAFDDGRLGANTIINDMPRAFGDYSPENFDRVFRGEVRAREALQHSLNLPAVAALSAIGADRFLASIGAAGIDVKARTTAGKKPGLALALGGAGVTAQDLGRLYAGLADGGVMKPLDWTETQQDATAYRLFSDDAARRINAILADAPALEGRAPAALARGAARIAFKTGTSYGFRDAWAAGHNGNAVDPGFTVVAWVGRADGAPRTGETGRKAAAPLLFDAFDLIATTLNAGRGVDSSTQQQDAPAVARLAPAPRSTPPSIVFPRDGVELFVNDKARGFVLAARGGAGNYRWYADGMPIDTDAGRPVWAPNSSGFYDITVVDSAGRVARSKVRVRVNGIRDEG